MGIIMGKHLPVVVVDVVELVLAFRWMKKRNGSPNLQSLKNINCEADTSS